LEKIYIYTLDLQKYKLLTKYSYIYIKMSETVRVDFTIFIQKYNIYFSNLQLFG